MAVGVSALFRSVRRQAFPLFTLFLVTWAAVRAIERWGERRREAAFFAPVVLPSLPPLPPRTPDQTEAECRAARIAERRLDAVFAPILRPGDGSAEQLADLKRRIPRPPSCPDLDARNFSSGQEEWKFILRNLPMTLLQDFAGTTPEEEGVVPMLQVPRTAPEHVRMDLAIAWSYFADKLTAPDKPPPLQADSYKQFGQWQGYKHWHYGYRRKNWHTGEIEPFALFNMTRSVEVEVKDSPLSQEEIFANATRFEIEHWTQGHRFPKWLAVGNTTQHPAVARRLTSGTSLHTFTAIRMWKSDYEGELELSGKVMRDGACGDGIVIRVLCGNETVYERDVPPDKEKVTITWDVHFTVAVGTEVEVQIDPKRDDTCDRTSVWATISSVDPDEIL